MRSSSQRREGEALGGGHYLVSREMAGRVQGVGTQNLPESKQKGEQQVVEICVMGCKEKIG